ncbi:MAG: CopG family transcriptional regulator [Nanobdellota archaeon]
MKIEVPKDIIKVLKKRVDETSEFNDVEEYITDILQQVVERLKQEDESFSKEDEEKIEERLRGLGYLG